MKHRQSIYQTTTYFETNSTLLPRPFSWIVHFKLFSFCCLLVTSIFLFTPDLLACETGQANEKVNCDSDFLTLYKAANTGDKRVQFKLGLAYETGRGVAKNTIEAVKWYEKASNQNELDARHNLALMYRNGEGLKKDIKKAFELELSAAKLGQPNAQNRIGVDYLDGILIKRDTSEAEKWFMKSANQGFFDAQMNLANFYKIGWGGAINFQKAFYWFEKAALAGNAQAEYEVCVMYKNGRGVEKNNQEAYQWCKKAAQNGHLAAQLRMGAFEYGAVPESIQNYENAIFWWLKAAAAGSADAQYFLGKAYESKKDILEAQKWYELAARQGQKEAVKKLNSTR